MDRGERRTELLDLLQRDYLSARALMSSASGAVDRTRTFGFALVAALIGFTAANHTLWLGLLATLASGLLAYLDGIQSSRYNEASKHALRIERIEQLGYKALTGTFNEREEQSLNVRMAAFRPGVLTGQGRFAPRDLRYSLPLPILILYLLLAGAGIGIGIYESTSSTTTTVDAHVLSDFRTKERHPSDLTIGVRDAMTAADRARLAKIAQELRRSPRHVAHAMSADITALLRGTPGAAARVLSAVAQSGEGMNHEAGEIIDKALIDAVGAAAAGGGSEPMVNDSQFHLSLSGPSFVFNTAASNATKHERRGSNEHYGGDPEYRGGEDKDGSGTDAPGSHKGPTTRSRTLPVTP